MLIHAWNIRAAAPGTLPRTLEVIATHNADTLVLGEVTRSNHSPLSAALRGLGYTHLHSGRPAGRARGVMIASKVAFAETDISAGSAVDAHRWQEVYFPKKRLRLAGLYFPDTPEPITAFWPRVHEAAGARRADHYLLLGDLNSGHEFFDAESGKLTGDPWFTAMPYYGMYDLWRHKHRDAREYTWYSPKGKLRSSGFRLDHAFGSLAMRRRVREIWYSHDERERRVSDHSSLLLRVH